MPDSRPSQDMEESAEELVDFIRRLAIARGRRGPTSAPRAGGFHPSTQTIPEERLSDEATSSNEGMFQLGLSRSIVNLLTTLSGGVALGARPKKVSAECIQSSLASDASSSSSSVHQLERTMTPEEVEGWARNHNEMYLQCLNNSVSARNNATTPRTPASRHSMNTTSLHTSSSDSPPTASYGSSYFNLSGWHSHRSSHLSPTPVPASVPTPQSALSHVSHPFRPNNMVLERLGVPVTPSSRGLPGSNYLGRRHSPSGAREVEGLLDWENCALFLTKILVEVTLHEIFSVITTGAVFCLHINPPSGIHTTKAAKLAFMNPEGAAAFLDQIRSPEGVVLHGNRIQGRYNRNGYARNENIWQSRVLELIGPTPMMTLAYWTSHFAMFSEFELETYRLLPTNVDGVRIMEFRFARIDGQAQTCLQCIRTDPSLKGVVQVRYGNDPCGSSMAC